MKGVILNFFISLSGFRFSQVLVHKFYVFDNIKPNSKTSKVGISDHYHLVYKMINKKHLEFKRKFMKRLLSLGVVNASFSRFSVIATDSSVYVLFGSVDLVRIFLDLFLVTLN